MLFDPRTGKIKALKHSLESFYDPYGNRTHVTAVKGPCLNRLTNGPYKYRASLKPPTSIIRNCDADAVFAVYPFTPQQAISDAIIKASYIPVFCGVGGGTTHGVRTLNLARDVESQGAMGVVLNSPISDLNLLAVSRVVDIPVIITVTKEDTDIRSRIESGASILNVACSTDTPRIVKKIRDEFPDVPIIASGGKTGESISATIAAGANAITYTPPSPAILFKDMMEKYRE